MTRNRLVAAAFEQFSTLGYASTTIDGIARAAGTSRATFYLHFTGKADALVAGWQDLRVSEVEELYRRLDAVEPLTVVALRSWLDDFLGYWELHRNICVASVDAQAFEPRLAASWVEGMELTVTWVPQRSAVLGGGDDARIDLLLWLTQLERAAYLWCVGAVDVKRDQLLDGLLRSSALALRVDREG
jgi:AcrR family transcriptional regulator